MKVKDLKTILKDSNPENEVDFRHYLWDNKCPKSMEVVEIFNNFNSNTLEIVVGNAK